MGRSRQVAVARRISHLVVLLSLLLLAAQAAASTSVAGPITADTTWDVAGAPYVVQGNVQVSAAAVLTISPGVVVKFAGDAALTVYGSLQAHGETGRIFFTSLRDDTLGGDTNGDGNATEPAPGDWAYVYFAGGSRGSLANCDLRYAGKVANNWAALILASSPSVAGCSIEYSDWVGLDATSYADRTPAGLLADNELAHNGSYAMQLGWPAVAQLAGSGWSIHDNALNAVKLAFRQVVGSKALPFLAPYISYVAATNGILVPAGDSLTIKPGVVVKFAAGEALAAYGGLLAQGTAAAPVVLTSIKDDGAGGDSNGDGGNTFPAPGDWAYVLFDATSTGALESCVVRYAGSVTSAWGQVIARSAPRIANCRIEHGAWVGLDASAYADRTAAGLLADNELLDNGSYALRVNWEAAAQLAGDAWRIEGNAMDAAALTGRDVSGDRVLHDFLPGISYVTAPTGILVPAGDSLSVDPGVVLKLAPGTALAAYGALKAQGTAEKPIIVTSLRDDSVGGDSNGDGAATAPSPGDWTYLYLAASATGALDRCVLRYAGSASSAKAALIVAAGVPISRCTIEHSAWVGIDASAYPDLVPAGLLADNSVVDSGSYALQVGWFAVPQLTGSAWSIHDNALNAIKLTDRNVPGSKALPLLQPDLSYVASASGIFVPNGATLTLGPGVVLKLDASLSVLVYGQLRAEGAAATPVTITSLRDDTVGGDSNGDGTGTAPAPGDWSSLVYVAGSTGALDHCVLRYGGDAGGASAMLRLYSSLAASWCVFERSEYDGVNVSGGAPTFLVCTIRDNLGCGVVAEGSGAPVLRACGVTGNLGDYGVLARGAGRPNLGDLSNATTADDGRNWLSGNAHYAVGNLTSATLPAQNNFWGTANTAAIDALIFDKLDSPAYGQVVYEPFALCKPVFLVEDMNGDYAVDEKDLVLFMDAWRKWHDAQQLVAAADFDGNGAVDRDDARRILALFYSCGAGLASAAR